VMRKTVTAVALACVAGMAQAADGLYAGAGITRAQVDDIFGPDSDLRIDNTSWKAFLGFKFPLIPLGVETDYTDLGSRSRNFGFIQGHADAKAFSAFAVGYLPLPLPYFDLYGKAGAARWQLSGDTVRPSLFRLNDNGNQFAWGIGTQIHISNLAVRLEYENFDIRNTDGARVYTLGAAWYFL
jgi:OmpA-OmpF porin, OOP family